MAQVHSLCLCNKLVVVLLIDFLFDICTAFRDMKGSDHRTHKGKYILFIYGQPVLDPVAEVFKQYLCIILEPLYRLRIGPGAFFIQRGRHIKVEHGNDGGNIVLQTFVDQIVIEIDSLLINLSGSFWKDAGPCDGKTVGFKAHLSHEGNVFLVVMIMIGAGGKVSGALRQFFYILAGRPFAVFGVGAFYLISGSGCSPEEVFGKRFKCFMQHDEVLLYGLSRFCFAISISGYRQNKKREITSRNIFSKCDMNLHWKSEKILHFAVKIWKIAWVQNIMALRTAGDNDEGKKDPIANVNYPEYFKKLETAAGIS